VTGWLSGSSRTGPICGPWPTGSSARLALIDGAPGAIWAQGGTIRVVFDFTIMNGKVVAIEMMGDPGRISELEVVPLTSAGRRPGRGG
jgi:hypothetical protein